MDVHKVGNLENTVAPEARVSCVILTKFWVFVFVYGLYVCVTWLHLLCYTSCRQLNHAVGAFSPNFIVSIVKSLYEIYS